MLEFNEGDFLKHIKKLLKLGKLDAANTSFNDAKANAGDRWHMFKLDGIFKIEDGLESALKEIHSLLAITSDHTYFYDPELSQAVFDLYKEDFLLYDYAPQITQI